MKQIPTRLIGLAVMILSAMLPAISNAQCVPPAISQQPASVAICDGSASTSFTVTATGTTLTYQWQVDDGSGFTDITNNTVYSGAGTATLTITGPTASMDDYEYRCVVSGACSPDATSDAAVLDVHTALSITTQPDSKFICEGGSATFTVVASGEGATYQWQIRNGGSFTNLTDGGIYSGTGTNTLTLTNVSTDYHLEHFRCIVSNECNSITSSVKRVEVRELPTIEMQPEDSLVCSGEDASFRIEASGTDISYQWEVNNGGGFVPVSNGGVYSGATSDMLVITGTPETLDGYTYRCVVSGTCSPAATSSVVELTVNSPIVITVQPMSIFRCEGGSGNIAVVITGQGASYQWQIDDRQGGGFVDMVDGGIYSGTTTPTLTFTGIPSSIHLNYYRCIIKNKCSSLLSETKRVEVRDLPSVDVEADNATTCEGGNASFTIGASGHAITYQWEVNDGSGYNTITDGGVYAGATTATLSITGATYAMDEFRYRCKVSGTCTPDVTSAARRLYVHETPAITTQATDAVICDGGDASFTIETSGSDITYQWQVDDGSGFADITNGGIYDGAKTATLEITGATTAEDGLQFRCVARNICTILTSTNVTLTVHSLPDITSQPADITVCEGQNANFTVAHAGTGITYQWQVDDGTGFTDVVNGTDYTGAATATLTVNSTTVSMDGFEYRCVLDNGNCTLTSGDAELTINTLPAISTQPESTVVCDGSNASFTLAATGTGIAYQWQIKTSTGSFTDVVDGGVYSGAATATLAITGAASSLNGSEYQCVVTGTCAPDAVSDLVTLTVNDLPVVTVDPADMTICTGDQASFTLSATGTALTFQWQCDDGTGFADISDNAIYSGTQTGTLLVTGPDASYTSYRYRCIVSGACTPSQTTAAARLIVHDVEVTSQTTHTTVCEGTSTVFTMTVKGAAMNYTWQVNDGNGFANIVPSGTYSGINTTTLHIIAPQDNLNGYEYRCVVQGICTYDTTEAIVFTVNDKPEISVEPVDVTTKAGVDAMFMVQAHGYDFHYYWQASTDNGQTFVNLSNNANYSGVSTNSLQIYNVSDAQSGYSYRCVVKENGNCGFDADSSRWAYLTVQSAASVGNITRATGFSVYPNPVAGNQLTIQADDAVTGELELRIINTLGVELNRTKVSLNQANTATVNVASLPAGIYTIVLTDKQQQVAGSVRFTKQ